MVIHTYVGRTGTGIAAVIGYGQGDDLSADICAAEIFSVQVQAGDAADIVAVVVDIRACNVSVPIGIQFYSHIPADRRWGQIILYAYIGRTVAGITVVIGYGQGDELCADICAVEMLLVQAQIGDSAGIVAVVVDVRNGDVSVAVGIQFHRRILADRRRSYLVIHTYVGRTGACKAAIIGNGPGDRCGTNRINA